MGLLDRGMGMYAKVFLPWQQGAIELEKPYEGWPYFCAASDAQKLSPSPGTPGEGGGEGLYKPAAEDPHPNPLPEYRERG